MHHDPLAGKSALGTPIPLFASKPLSELRSPIFLMGGVHGDEPEGVELATKTLEMLRQSKAKYDWVLIPNINPDGVAKNSRVNGRGVDLNRNYPSKSWSAAFEQDRYNPGSGPGSEPEVQLVVKVIQELKPRIAIHCHSWNPMVVCTGEPGLSEANMLGRACGYEVVPEIGYQTPGSLSQYGWHDHGIPVICIEEQNGIALPTIWPRFESGMREVFGVS